MVSAVDAFADEETAEEVVFSQGADTGREEDDGDDEEVMVSASEEYEGADIDAGEGKETEETAAKEATVYEEEDAGDGASEEYDGADIDAGEGEETEEDAAKEATVDAGDGA